MAKKIYIGNLPYRTTEDELRDLFAPYGEILSVRVVYDRVTGRSRGFGFVELNHPAGNVFELDGKQFGGRDLRLCEGKAREEPGLWAD